jgi:uncharacterized membrane protein YeaQ/YmgE (transglycosylase-associated protein family)
MRDGSKTDSDAETGRASSERSVSMNLYIILLIGVTVSLLARFLARRKGLPGGWAAEAYGVLGAFFGGWLGHVFGLYEGGNLGGYLLSAAAASVFIVFYRMVARRHAST